MLDNTQNIIDIKKLSDTEASLNSINTLLNKSTLDESFDFLSKELNNLNFEHGNLFPNYQIYLNKIYNRIIDIKNDILSLEDNIKETIKDTDNIEVLSDVSDKITNSISDTVDSIPIGLGIAASGITAAIGTHIVDQKDEKKVEFPHIEKEKPKTEDFNFDIDYDEPDDTLDFLKDKKEEPIQQYEAKRNKSSLEEYYENDNN